MQTVCQHQKGGDWTSTSKKRKKKKKKKKQISKLKIEK